MQASVFVLFVFIAFSVFNNMVVIGNQSTCEADVRNDVNDVRNDVNDVQNDVNDVRNEVFM